MHGFNLKFAEGYIIAKYRSGSILVLICKILVEMALFRLIFCWYVDIGFCSVSFAGITLEVCRRIYHYKLEQVDGAPSHIPTPAPSHISMHIKIQCVPCSLP